MQHHHFITTLFSLLILLTYINPLSLAKHHHPRGPKRYSLHTDARALLDFKHKADPHNKLSFSTKHSHCKWQGVECLGIRVFRLIIEDTDLSGGIFAPATLTRLDQLRVLSLRNNSLSGPIPDLSGLTNLKALFLNQNRFSGSFPPSIATLHRIRTIDLSYNNFTGELPEWLTQLDRLYYLSVEFNRFVGEIPPLNQTTLLVFNVSSNNLSGPVPVTPALAQFPPSAFSLNPGLCGEIVNKECHISSPFFGPAAATAPEPFPSSPSSSSPKVLN